MTVKRGVGQGFGFGIGCLLLGVVIVVALIGIVMTTPRANVATGSTPAPTRAPTRAPIVATAIPSPATADPAASPTSAPTVAPREPAMLLSLHGQGIQRTAKFTAPGDWTISYSYDCTTFGQSGILQVYVYNADGTLEDVAVNALGEEGSGSQPEYTPGSFYLEVNSVCDWIVAAKG